MRSQSLFIASAITMVLVVGGFCTLSGTGALGPNRTAAFARELSPSETAWPLCPKEGGLCGYIGKDGKWLVEPIFDFATFLDKELAFVKLNGKAGYIGRDGRLAVPAKFNGLQVFRNGLAAARIEEKWGYIDAKGAWKIEPKFDAASPFYEDIARVEVSGKSGLVNKNGEWVVQPTFRSIGAFSEGLAVAVLNDRAGYINKRGEWVIEPKFVVALPFAEGLASVGKTSSERSYIDKSGEIQLQTKCARTMEFSEGLAWCAVSFDFKDTTSAVEAVRGKRSFTPEGKFVFLDRTGAVVISDKMDDAQSFKSGFARATQNGKKGLIDKTGKWVVEPIWDEAHLGSSDDHFAWVKRDLTWQILNRSGKVITNLPYERVLRYGDLVHVGIGDRNGYVDLWGNKVVDLPSTNASSRIQLTSDKASKWSCKANGENGAVGYSHDASEAAAKNIALNNCKKTDPKNCRVTTCEGGM